MKPENLAKNGVFYSIHAKDKMREEGLIEKDIIETVTFGQSVLDHSNQNDKSRAWSKRAHWSCYWDQSNLTVIWCESYEKGLMIVSVFHGKAHDIDSNPYFHGHFSARFK